jgi:DNA repair photolyase
LPRPVSNPPNPWSSQQVEWLEEPPPVRLEVFEEQAKEILAENDSPDLGFRWSLNPYRGCFHGCAYCLSGDTLVLMGDGTTKPLSDVRVGDVVYGTELRGRYRRYIRTPVLAHWRTEKLAHRVSLEDGTTVVASGDHRFLTERGWKYVTGRGDPSKHSPHLTTNNSLLGIGALRALPEESEDYRSGYLCGMIRGDGHLADYAYQRAGRAHGNQHQFRLALIDADALVRSRRYLASAAVPTHEFCFQAASATRRAMTGIRTHSRANVDRVRSIVRWPASPSDSWHRGFLAGIFDAEGSYSGGVLRISNTDLEIVDRIGAALRIFGFDHVVELKRHPKPLYAVRVRGGLREHLRFFHETSTAISRKRDIEGAAVKSTARLRVSRIECLGVVLPMFDITTGTGDFIANGVISHNCYARPSHQHLGFGAGTDFERKIVVKTNAPEALRAAFAKRSWKGELIVISGNTDCYQPLEASYGLTRRVLEVCLEHRNPVGIITKGALVARDADVLAALARDAHARVFISIPFADASVARRMEPFAASPERRFEAMRRLSDAGVPTGISLAPIIPGLNDSDVATQLERAKAAGAGRAFYTMLRLSAEVHPVFEERLHESFPERERKVWNGIREVRGGKDNVSEFGRRMVGEGPRWRVIEDLFDVTCRRLGIGTQDQPVPRDTFRRPSKQRMLFDDSK